ncbi:MAG: phosphatase PAP2 family protein [Verrucomicrobiales bacterium]
MTGPASIHSPARRAWTSAGRWFAELRDDLEKPPSGPRLRPRRWVVAPLLAVAVVTIGTRLSNFDLAAQETIYRAGGNSWSLGDHPFWKALYHVGTLPATLVVFAAIVGYVLSWSRPSFRRWRRVFLFVVLSGALGPGIVANAGLKEYWGRPRPREVQGMGGHERFESILSIDRQSDGKSFPCGHATMGFYFFGAFFLLRRHRRRLAEGFLFGTLIVGGLMGVARMLQGAHFFSDVVWAAAVCYFASMGLYYALGLDRSLVRRGLGESLMPFWLKASVSGLALALGVAVMVASPYRAQRNLFIVNDFAKSGPLVVQLQLTVGDVEIVGGDEFRITGEAYGHGVPTSKIDEYYKEFERDGFSSVVYAERMSGWFAEVSEQIRVEIPWHRLRKLTLKTGEANIRIDLQDVEGQARIHLMDGEGLVRVVRSSGATVPLGEESESSEGVAEEAYELTEGEEFSGRVVLENRPAG